MNPCSFRTTTYKLRPPCFNLFRSVRRCTIFAPQYSSSSIADKASSAADATCITDRLTGTQSHSTASAMVNPFRVGKVRAIVNSIACVDGFTAAKPYSFVEFDNGVRGLVLCVDGTGCKIGIVDRAMSGAGIQPSDLVRLDKVENYDMPTPQTTVGPGLIGRIVDVYGNDFTFEHNQPLSSPRANFKEPQNAAYKLPVYKVNLFPNSKYITKWKTYSRLRQRIHTGIKSIDTFYPFARGLRSAIIGKNRHRKSELAIDILLSFASANAASTNIKKKMFGVYVMIGKSADEIWRLYNILQETGALEYSTIVVSRADDFMSKQLLTPYTGAAIADFFKFYGLNSFIVYDNLTVHNRVCSKVYRESKGLTAYGNWSGELLERASQLNARFGGGSHTALCLADRPTEDDELNIESETFFNYLPHLVGHVDEHIMLCDDSGSEGSRGDMVPPISLFPVPFGTPKFMKYNAKFIDASNSTPQQLIENRYNQVLSTLSVSAKKTLFELVELEQAARQQMELDLELEWDVERIASNVYKLQTLFCQQEEVNTQQLILVLLCIHHRMTEYVHLDKIDELEARLYQCFFQDTNEFQEKLNAIFQCIEQQGHEYDIVKDEETLKLVHMFLDHNNDLCQPNALSWQNLEQPQSDF